MAVFIRKFAPGGDITSNEQTPPNNNQQQTDNKVRTFRIGNNNVELDKYIDALANNFQSFYDTYESTWTPKEREGIMREHKLFLKNLQEGNITGMNEDGSFDVVNRQYSGLDFSPNGAGRRYAYYAKRIANTAHPSTKSEKTKASKKFTNTSLLRDFHNQFFGGVDDPDYQSFFDLDEIVEGPDGQKKRNVRNRVDAILDFLDENYISRYDDADESLGGIEGVRTKIQRLRKALADGQLNNEDYAAAASLGLNLRGLLSTDGNIQFDANGRFSTATPTESASDPVREALFGQATDAKKAYELIGKEISQWETNTDPDDFYFQLNSPTNISSNDLLEKYFKNDVNKFKEHLEGIASNINGNGINYYKDSNFIGGQHNYLRGMSDSEYIRSMLNAMVDFRNILGIKPEQDENGKTYYVIPNSFDAKKGTILKYYPDNGVVKTIKIWKSNNKDYIQSYFLKKYPVLGQQAQSHKNGGILKGQYGFGVPQQSQVQYTDAEIRLMKMLQEQGQLEGEENTGEEVPIEEETPESKQQQYLQSETGPMSKWGSREWTEIASIAADVASIINPEPISAAGMGLAGTIAHGINLARDEDGWTWGDTKETGLNLLFDAAGALPVVGDSAQAYKVYKGIMKIGAPLLGFLGAMNMGEAKESVEKLLSKEGKMTPQDWRNIANGLAAVVGAKNYWQNKGKARALDAAHGVPKVEKYREGILDVNINGEKKSIKIADEEEIKTLRQNLQKAGTDKAAATDAIRNSKTIKNYASQKGIDIEKIEAVEAPSGKIRGNLTPEFSRETRGFRVNEKTRVQPGTKDMFVPKNEREALYDRLYRRGREFGRDPNPNGESLVDWVKGIFNKRGNPFESYYKGRYGQPVETPKAEAPKAEAPKTETPKAETPKTETSKAAETPKAETPKAETLKAEPKTEPKQEAPKQTPKTEEPKIETPKQESYVKKEEPKSLPLIDKKKEENMNKATGKQKLLTEKTQKTKSKAKATNKVSDNIKQGGKRYYQDLVSKLPDGEVKNQAKEYLKTHKTKGENKFKKSEIEAILKKAGNVQLSLFSKNGSKLDVIRKFQKGTGKTGIGLSSKANSWHKDIFSGYKQYILDRLKNEGEADDFAYWLNDMQHRHSVLRGNADNSGKDWRKNSYQSDDVKKYQEDYRGGTNGKYHGYYTPGTSPNFNTSGIAPNADSRYDFYGNNNRISGDWGDENWKPEGLYSSITDDRRLLGRKINGEDDWDPNDLESFRNELKQLGWTIDLDTSDNYYKLKRLSTPAVNSLHQGVDIPIDQKIQQDLQSKININTGTGSTGGTGTGGKYGGGGDQVNPAGTRKPIDYKKYIPGLLALGRMIGDNEATRRRTEDWIRRLQVPLQQPWQFHRQVYGDYGALKYAENQAAQIRSQMNRPVTSNANLASLRQLEGERLAAEQKWKGFAADNQKIHETYEKSAAEQKGNIERATSVANTNRGLMASIARDKANALATADVAMRNNLDNWLMYYVEKPIQEEIDRKKAYQDYYDYTKLGSLNYDFSNDERIMADRIRYEQLLKEGKQEEAEALVQNMMKYKRYKAEAYRRAKLRQYRDLHGLNDNVTYDDFLILPSKDFKYISPYLTDEEKAVVQEEKPKEEKGGNLPKVIVEARTKDNNRLVKQVLEIIRNHKDLTRGLKVTDYSKYIRK